MEETRSKKKKKALEPWEKECPKCRLAQSADTKECPFCHLEMPSRTYINPKIVERMKQVASGKLTTDPNVNKDRPWMKLCPQCQVSVSAHEKVCSQCRYKFPRATVISFEECQELERQANLSKITGSAGASEKSSNPRAPRKTCPSCGEKVLINRYECPHCEYHFPRKAKGTPSGIAEKASTETKEVQTEEKPREQYVRAAGAPWKAYIILLITMLVFSAISFLAMSLVHARLGGWWSFAIFIVLLVLAFIVAMLSIAVAGNCYGYRSKSFALVFAVLIVGGVLFLDIDMLFDPFGHFTFLSEWVHQHKSAAMPLFGVMIVCSIEMIVASLGLYVGALSQYCYVCDMPDLVEFVEEVEAPSSYAYKFKTHEAKTKTATIHSRGEIKKISSPTPEFHTSNESTITYETQAWQENLGMHKYTPYTKYYRCKRCGNVTTETGTREEKVLGAPTIHY